MVYKKAYRFALEIIRLYKFLSREQKEFVLSKQLLRSGTAIGALLKEAEHAQSKPDFLNKTNIALKEANETGYWLDLLKDAYFLEIDMYQKLKEYNDELVRMLSSIVKTTKQNLKK